jgi:carboxymethylenebutenolidase
VCHAERMEPGSRAGSAYLVVPDDGRGHGVLVLHSWWGLTPSVKAVVERLADAGYTALAPDLLAGAAPDDPDDARQVLADSDPNETAALILSSVVALRANSADHDAAVAVVGYSMGASWALWLATRQPVSVDAVVAFYGAQNIDFVDLAAPVLGHFAEDDPFVTEDELVEMQAQLMLLDHHIEFHRYPGARHWFDEDTPVSDRDREASTLAWERTLDFLARHAPPRPDGPSGP